MQRQKEGGPPKDSPSSYTASAPAKPKKKVTAEDFKNRRVSKGVKHDDGKKVAGGTAALLSKIKRKREKEEQEAKEAAERLAKTPFAVRKGALLEERVQDILSYSFKTGAKPL